MLEPDLHEQELVSRGVMVVVSVDNAKVKVPKLVVLVTVDKVKVPKLMVLVNRNLSQPSHNLYKTHKKR